MYILTNGIVGVGPFNSHETANEYRRDHMDLYEFLIMELIEP